MSVIVGTSGDRPNHPDVAVGLNYSMLGRDGDEWEIVLLDEPPVDLTDLQATVAAQQATIEALLDALGGSDG